MIISHDGTITTVGIMPISSLREKVTSQKQYGCFFKTTLEKNVKIIIKKTIRESKDTEKKYPVAAKNILSRSSDICVILQRNFENKYEVTF